MELKCEDKRLEALRLQYQKRKQPTDKEVIEDLTEFDEEDPCQDNFQDSFLIEPFERKEEWHSAKFNADGHLAVQKNQDEGYDLLRDRVDKVIIDSFSLKKEIRHCKFDSNGNFIPLDEYDEEEEEEEEFEEPIPEYTENKSRHQLQIEYNSVLNERDTLLNQLSRLIETQMDEQ